MDTFAALGSPVRRRIVELLAGRELPAGEISARFELTAPAISQHLKVLCTAKLLRVRAEGRRQIYALDDDGLGALAAWLEKLRARKRREK